MSIYNNFLIWKTHETNRLILTHQYRGDDRT